MDTKRINIDMDRTRRIFVIIIALAVLAVIVGRLLQMESELRQYRVDLSEAQSQLSRLQSQQGEITSPTAPEVAALPMEEAKPSEATPTPPIAATAPASSATTIIPSPLPTATATGTPTSLPTAATLPPRLSSTTITATDTPTAMPDTPAGTILDVGQTWRQADLDLTLKESQLSIANHSGDFDVSYGVEIRFTLASRKAQDISLRYSLADVVQATDNRNRRLQIGFKDQSWSTKPFSGGFDTLNIILKSGQTIDLFAADGYFATPWVFVVADTSDPSVTEIIVAVSGISGINNTRWRIPIPH